MTNHRSIDASDLEKLVDELEKLPHQLVDNILGGDVKYICVQGAWLRRLRSLIAEKAGPPELPRTCCCGSPKEPHLETIHVELAAVPAAASAPPDYVPMIAVEILLKGNSGAALNAVFEDYPKLATLIGQFKAAAPPDDVAALKKDFDSVLKRASKCGDARRELELEVKRLRNDLVVHVAAARAELLALRTAMRNLASKWKYESARWQDGKGQWRMNPSVRSSISFWDELLSALEAAKGEVG